MSKSYQHWAGKRYSHYYHLATRPCTFKKPNRFITCPCCISRIGTIRKAQKEFTNTF